MPASQTPQPKVHVHVPFWRFDEYVDFLRADSLSFELYIGSSTIDNVTEAELTRVKAAMDWGHTLSVHGPFMDLSPGAVDSKIAAASLERYLQVIEFCEVLRPEVVVFHSGYEKWKYGDDTRLWLDKSMVTWRAVMAQAEKVGVKVAIENIVDTVPDHLVTLAERMDHPLFGLCLDVGHRELFSDLPISAWVERMGRHIFELHLHDNNGVGDDHMPVGDGRIDFVSLFASVDALGIQPVYTLEAHSKDDAVRSIAGLAKYI